MKFCLFDERTRASNGTREKKLMRAERRGKDEKGEVVLREKLKSFRKKKS
jgi:hypothetical protein